MYRGRGRGNGFHGRDGSNNGFNNPSMAPSVKVIDPIVDKEIQRKLEEFQQSDNPCLIFPSDFSRAQRKRVHELALRYGLISYSQGKDPNRKCIVRHRKVNLMSSVSAQETNPITLTANMRAKIRDFINKYPISEYDINKHNSSKAMKSRSNHRKDTQRMTYPQIPPQPSSMAFRSQREQLPAFAKRAEILHTIHNKQVVLITGGTGCGKTTQIPQFLLEDSFQTGKPLRIICTQPRRLPAIAVAERVAKERGEQLGGTVGYHIRLEQRTSDKTVLTYCTSGVLLRLLTQEDAVHSMTHIILDEIHEREQNTDYLLIALKQALRKESKIKVILMSATMEGNIEIFKRYFDVPVHHIDIPSRLYNVEKFFLGDVLAMTGYCPPDSIWCTGFTSNSASNSSSFQVTQWGGNATASSSNNMFMAQTSVPPPTFSLQPQQPQIQQQDPYSNVAQQLATSQTNYLQQYQAPNGQPYGQVNESYAQHGMSHAHTWASGMDKGGGNMPDVVNISCTAEDIQHFNAGFQEHDGSHYGQDQGASWHQPPPQQQQSWNPQEWAQQQQQSYGHQSFGNMPPMHNGHQMAYFQQPMDGTVRYEPPPPQRSISQSALGSTFPTNITEDGFGAALRRESMEKKQKKKYLQEALPNRPQFFTPSIRQIIRESGHPITADLPSIYMDLGGQQHADGIDADLVVAVTKHCMDSQVPGSILIFLPGYDDINEVKDRIMAQCNNLRHKPQVFTLHSQMNSADQQKVFDPIDPSCRKVILSTNIAEASLTIDDVVFVIDTGKVKEKTYDHNSRISQLKVTPIARSNAEQRSGRAGRCREGFCFRLYSAHDYERMLPTQMAEMQRSAIHDVCLHAKMFAPDNMSVRQFLQMAPEPPPPMAIDNSMIFLEQLGALYSEASTSDLDRPAVRGFSQMTVEQKEPEMTPLGRLIAQLPLEPQLARLLLFGLSLKCLSSVITLVAALSHRDPFLLPLSEERDRANLSRDHFGLQDFSDHLSLLRAINEFEAKSMRESFGFCRTNFLSVPGMKMILGIRRQLLCELRRCQLIEYDGDPNNALVDPTYNKYSDCWPMIQVAIVAGCYPGIGFTKSGSKMRKIRTTSEKNATLHPSSIIKRQLMTLTKMSNASNPGPQIEYLAFHEFTKLDEGLTLRTVTAVPPLPLVLSAGGLHVKQSTVSDFRIATGPDCESDDENEPEPDSFTMPQHQILELEDWICVRGTSANMRDIVRLRFKLMSYFLEVIADPRMLRNPEARHVDLLETLNEVLSEDHQRHKFDQVKSIAPTPKISNYGHNNSNWNRPPPQQQQQNNDQYNDMRRNASAPQSFSQFQPQEQSRAPQQQQRDGGRQEQQKAFNGQDRVPREGMGQHGQYRQPEEETRHQAQNSNLHQQNQQSYQPPVHQQQPQQQYRRVDPSELFQPQPQEGREAAHQEQKPHNSYQERRQFKFNQDQRDDGNRGYQNRENGGGWNNGRNNGQDRNRDNNTWIPPAGYQDCRKSQGRDTGDVRNDRRDNNKYNSNGGDWRNGESSSYDRSNDRGGGNFHRDQRDDGNNGKFSRGGNNRFGGKEPSSNGYNRDSYRDNGGMNGGGRGNFYNNGGRFKAGQDKSFENHDQPRQGNRPYNNRRPYDNRQQQNEDIPEDPKIRDEMRDEAFSRQGSQGGSRKYFNRGYGGGAKKNEDYGPKTDMVFTNSARKSNSKGSVAGRF